MSFRIAALASLALSIPATAFAADYVCDPAHSAANFKVKHMMVSTVRGEFATLECKVTYDEKNVAATRVEATLDANSIDTHEPKRDAHLKSPDFFDAAKNPTITFKSTKVEGDPKKGLKITGDLTMRGVTKPVTLETEAFATAKDPMGNTKIGTTATGKVNRKDWGLNWNMALEAGGVLVSDDVDIVLDIELGESKAAVKDAAKAEDKAAKDAKKDDKAAAPKSDKAATPATPAKK